jgi:hypothetical protein
MAKWMTWMAAMPIVVACAAEPDDDGGASSGGEAGSSAGSSGSAEASESGSAEASESGGSAPVDLDCLDPTPRMQFDGVTPSGWVMCSDFFLHREEAVACLVPEAGNCDECSTDCSELPNGRCMYYSDSPCECVSGCETDADCGPGTVCACTGAIGELPRCVPAGCTTSADCGGGLCGISEPPTCGFNHRIACLDEGAECRVSSCEEDSECVCYAAGGESTCHDECGSGCG